MQTSENDIEREKSPAQEKTKQRSRSPKPRSASPRAAQLSELLHARTEHSFTRRIYSFNKERNPDLVGSTPSHRRQTCSSLIKRNSSLGGGSVISTRSRRTISMEGPPMHHPEDGDGEKTFRRACSSMGRARGRTSEFALNDELGFLVDQMPTDGIQPPSGCEWLQGHTMDDWLASQKRTRRKSTKQSRQHQDVPKKGEGSTKRSKNGAKRGVNSVQSVKEPFRAGGVVRGGIQTRIKPRDVQRQRQQFNSIGPSDRKSDSANNMSSGKLDDADLNVAMDKGRVRSARSKSAAPVKQRKAGGDNSKKPIFNAPVPLTQAKTPEDKIRRPGSTAQDPKKTKSLNSQSNMTKASASDSQNVQIRPRGLNPKTKNNRATQQRGSTTPKKNEIETSNDESRATVEPERAPRLETKCEIEEEEVMDAVEERHQINGEEERAEGNAEGMMMMDAAVAVADESSSHKAKLDAGCKSSTDTATDGVGGCSDDERQSSTTCTADDVSAAAPIGLEDHPYMQRNSLEHSDAEYCDAFSKSCRSSKDSGSAAQIEEEHAAESLRSRKKSFMTENTFHQDSESEDEPDDSERSSRDTVDQPKLEKKRSKRMTWVARLTCCKVPIKSCFCGVNISPGPENDNDLRHSVVLYD